MDIFTTAQASFFYHLFISLVLGLAILILLSYAKRLNPETNRRAWAGLLALVILQIILLLAGGWGLAGPGAFERTAIGNLERAVSLTSALVFGWIFLAPRRSRVADLLIPGLVFLTAGLAAVFTYLLASTVAIAPDLDFNATILSPSWEALRALTLIVLAVLVGLRRPGAWKPALAALAVLLLGAILQLLVGSSAGNLAEYTRLTELIAYPLMAYQVTTRLQSEIAPVPSQPEARTGIGQFAKRSRAPGPGFGSLEPGSGLEGRADRAAGWIGRLANADGALFLTWNPEVAELRTLGGWNSKSSAPIPGLGLELTQDSTFAAVVAEGQAARIAGNDLASDLRAFLEQSGLVDPGSVLVLPYPDERGLHAAVLLVRSRTSAPWTVEDSDTLQAFALPLSLVLPAPAPISAAASSSSRTTSLLEAAEADHLRTRVAELEAEVQRSGPIAPGLNPPTLEGSAAAGGTAAAEAWARMEGQAARLEQNLMQAIADRQERVSKLQEALQAAQDLVTAAQSAPPGTQAEGREETQALRLALERAERDLAEQRGARVSDSAGGWEVSGLPVVDRELVAALIKELHHPMSLAVSYADHLILDTGRKDGGLGKKSLERVRASLARTNTLVRALEKVALIHDKELPTDQAPISVGEILESCLGSSRDVIQEKSLVIHMEVAEELSTVQLDPGILQQVAEHLIHNAVLATPAHQAVEIRALTVSVEGSARPSLLISFHDGGPGIASEDYPRVFDRMSRTAGQPIEGLGDLGVGLAVASILVQRIGGRLWLESAPNQGTTFQALFPLESV